MQTYFTKRRRDAAKKQFKRIAGIVCARSYYNAGYSVRRIAKAAGVSAATIRNWLRVSGLRRVPDVNPGV